MHISVFLFSPSPILKVSSFFSGDMVVVVILRRMTSSSGLCISVSLGIVAIILIVNIVMRIVSFSNIFDKFLQFFITQQRWYRTIKKLNRNQTPRNCVKYYSIAKNGKRTLCLFNFYLKYSRTTLFHIFTQITYSRSSWNKIREQKILVIIFSREDQSVDT